MSDVDDTVRTFQKSVTMEDVGDMMCDECSFPSDLDSKFDDRKSYLVIPATKLWVAIDLVARALVPSVTTVYYVLFRNPQTVVHNVRNQIFPAVAAFLANSISRSLASVQKISVPLTFRIIGDDQAQAALTNGEEESRVPEESVDCLILSEPEEYFADVIFVHGLHGGIGKTWKQGVWRQDWHKLKHQTPVRRLSTGNLYVPTRKQSLKRTISGIYSKIPNKIARRDVAESEGESDDVSSCTSEDAEGSSECWPRDWLPQDCPNVRVIALNYSTDVLWCPVWHKKRHRTDLITRSQEMIEELLKHNVGKRPIIWVGHSKGGLFIKQILVNAWERNKHRTDVRDIFWNTKSIMWYGVPHRGSSLADYTLPLLRRSVELLEIQRNCDFLLHLHDRFLKIMGETNLNPDVFSFIETSFTLMSFMYLKIVAYDSADPKIGIKCDVPLDHREICKPAGRDCFLYLELVNMINRCIESVR